MDRHGWNERYGASEQTFVRDPNRLVVAEVDGLTPGVAIDLATGEGRHAVWLASLGWRVVAVDYADVGLRRAQARAQADGHAGRVALALADAHALRWPPQFYDLVLLSFFHPRPPERVDLYLAIANALRPGGRLVQVSYDKLHATEGVGGPRDPEILVDPPVVAAELAALGLEVKRADTVRLTTDTGDTVVDAIIRADRPRE